jgi:3-isopropylmalate dehydrogenase
MDFTIAVLPGDGVGPDVVGEAVKIMDALGSRSGHAFDPRYGSVGGNAIDESGTPLPEETAAICREADAILFGAVGGPKWDRSDATARPEDGLFALRKGLGLFANLRPVKVYPAIINSSPVKPHLLEGVDLMIVRELTGGLYFSQPKKRWRTSRGRRGVDTLRYTEQEIERIVRVGFELARGRRKLLTSADKANVLETSRLWREVAIEVSSDYPDVELEHIYADNLSMQLIKNPAHYDVIVSENTFGDILSDEAAVLVGSLGMLPSASLAWLPVAGEGPRRTAGLGQALYEPVHGSAPDIAGQGIANPIGTVLSMAMMLRHSLGLEEEAAAVERAVEGVLADGYRTPDIAGDGGEVVSTVGMGDLIAGRV